MRSAVAWGLMSAAWLVMGCADRRSASSETGEGTEATGASSETGSTDGDGDGDDDGETSGDGDGETSGDGDGDEPFSCVGAPDWTGPLCGGEDKPCVVSRTTLSDIFALVKADLALGVDCRLHLLMGHGYAPAEHAHYFVGDGEGWLEQDIDIDLDPVPAYLFIEPGTQTARIVAENRAVLPHGLQTWVRAEGQGGWQLEGQTLGETLLLRGAVADGQGAIHVGFSGGGQLAFNRYYGVYEAGSWTVDDIEALVAWDHELVVSRGGVAEFLYPGQPEDDDAQLYWRTLDGESEASGMASQTQLGWPLALVEGESGDMPRLARLWGTDALRLGLREAPGVWSETMIVVDDPIPSCILDQVEPCVVERSDYQARGLLAAASGELRLFYQRDDIHQEYAFVCDEDDPDSCSWQRIEDELDSTLIMAAATGETLVEIEDLRIDVGNHHEDALDLFSAVVDQAGTLHLAVITGAIADEARELELISLAPAG